jgi:hypothetical protein
MVSCCWETPSNVSTIRITMHEASHFTEENRMSPYSPPQPTIGNPLEFRFVRAALVLILTAIIAASSIAMVGPQIIVIVPLALGLGIFYALHRSFGSLVCFGYPFTFGLISAWIGYKEVPGYEQTASFAISIGIGLFACFLIAVGLWISLPDGKGKEPVSGN